MPCQTDLHFGGYCIHQEENAISLVNLSSDSLRVLVSGGSGMLGTALKEALAARGFAVHQLVRRAPEAPGQIQWNPASTPAVSAPAQLEGLSAAFHLSGANLSAHRWTAAYKRELAASRIDSTRALATTLASLDNPPRVLFVASAIGIYGNRGDELLDETSPPGLGFLPSLCRQWEDAAQPARDAGIRVVHLRLGVVLDSSGGALAKLLPLFRMGLGGKLGSGRQYMSWIALGDVLSAIFFLLDSPSACGPYNFTSPTPVTNEEFTRTLASMLRRPPLLDVPEFALRLAFGEMAEEALLASTRAYPARLAASGFQFAYPTLVHTLPVLLESRFR